MDKLLTRFVVIFIAIYFLISYAVAQFWGIDILRTTYVLLLEMCVVAFTFCSGKYHCRFIRWTALSILICDIVSHADYYFDFVPVTVYNFILSAILIVGVTVSATLAIRHFIRVLKVKKGRNGTLTN